MRGTITRNILTKAQELQGWIELRAAYPELFDDELLMAQEATYAGHRSQEDRDARPNYGFRFEHDGERTLGDFFKKHNMCVPEKDS